MTGLIGSFTFSYIWAVVAIPAVVYIETQHTPICSHFWSDLFWDCPRRFGGR